MVTQTYAAASRYLLVQAGEELAAGDTRQASEKGWGAAAQIVKSVAAQRGWEHRSHAALFNTVSRLVDETGDGDLRDLFHIASALQVNFYEDWDTADNVAGALSQMERFVANLEPLATAAPV